MTTATSAIPRLSNSIARVPTWKHFVLLWLVVAALEAALLAQNAFLDSYLWSTTRWFMGDQDAYVWSDVKKSPGLFVPFYESEDPPFKSHLYKRTENLWRLLRDMGEPTTTVLLLCVVGIYDRRRLLGSAILLSSTTGASLASELIRCVTGRLRPDGEISPGVRNIGENFFHFLGGFSHHRDLSFPSGHSTLAFATAATLCYFSPRGRWLFITLAAGCALTRVVMQAHFFGDVIMGSAVGWTLGWLITVQLDRLAPQTKIPSNLAT
jgi:membrane-associated phospholipid phosphatase